MTNKIIIDLVVPELDTTYSLFIPINVKIGKIVDLLNKSLYDLTKGVYVKENNFLYNNEGLVYPMNITVFEGGIINGNKLVLF